MIIYKHNLALVTRDNAPNENFADEEHKDNVYVVDDNSELGIKIIKNYPNIDYIIKNDEIVDVNIIGPDITIEYINSQVVKKIRERYSETDELQILRIAILDSTNAEYIAYNSYVEECRAWGITEKQKYGLI